MKYTLIALLFLFINSTLISCRLSDLEKPVDKQEPPPQEIIEKPPQKVYELKPRLLSRSNPEFKTCIFSPYQPSIIHFPMYHYPYNNKVSSPLLKEEVTYSQFQLMHTILDYSRAPLGVTVFDEQVASVDYSPTLYHKSKLYYTTITQYLNENTEVSLQYYKDLAERLFPYIPRYYEDLSLEQKNFLFTKGGSLTLYWLGKIHYVHRAISPEKNKEVLKHLKEGDQYVLEGKDYWVFDFREQALKEQILSFIQKNSHANTIILIAYGVSHKFHDEFAGFPFQSGHNFCMNWVDKINFQLDEHY